MENSRIKNMMKNRALLAVCAISWGVCSTLFGKQLFDIKTSSGCTLHNFCCVRWPLQLFSAGFFHTLGLSIETIVLEDREKEDKVDEPESWKPAGFPPGGLMAAVACFLFVVFPLVLMEPAGHSVILYINLLVIEGHVLIVLLVFYRTCCALLFSLLVGLVCTSFKLGPAPDEGSLSFALHKGQPPHQIYYYKFIVLLLSVFIVFLCALYYKLRALQFEAARARLQGQTTNSAEAKV